MNGKDQIIIGITGFKGTGKGEVARVLQNEYGFYILKFAGVLKKMLRTLGLTENEIEDPILKEKPHALLCGETPRRAMQTLGTEWGRMTMGESIWYRALGREIEKLSIGVRRFVVDDVRFLNEAGYLRTRHADLWRVVRPGRFERPTHVSEKEMENIIADVTIKNDGCLNTLANRVRTQMQQSYGIYPVGF